MGIKWGWVLGKKGGTRALESLMKWRGVSIKGAGGGAEGRALGMLKINIVHCTVLAKVKIKSPFSKNCKSSFYSKDFLPWSCESLNTLPK